MVGRKISNSLMPNQEEPTLIGLIDSLNCLPGRPYGVCNKTKIGQCTCITITQFRCLGGSRCSDVTPAVAEPYICPHCGAKLRRVKSLPKLTRAPPWTRLDFYQLFDFSLWPGFNQRGHRNAALFFGRNHRWRNDQYSKRSPTDMSKSICQIKSLHDHVITVISNPANGECTLCKHSL